MGTGNRENHSAVVLGMSKDLDRLEDRIEETALRLEDTDSRIDMLEERIKDDLMALETKLQRAIQDFGSPW